MLQQDAVNQLNLNAPMCGDFIPLNQVPDQAFAEKMVGDGVAIDPTEGKLVAPCDGEVVMIHPSKHAISLKVEGDLEILMHIGVDTVKLRGEGFTVKVEAGQTVKSGDLLIEFDMDSVAEKAASLITPILITDTDAVTRFEIKANNQIEIGQPLYTAILASNNNVNADVGEIKRSKSVKVANSTGIHARPSAHIVKIAKQYSGDISLIVSGVKCNARSVTSIMAMNIGFGSDVIFETNSLDAEQVLNDLEQAVLNGLGEDVQQAAEVVNTTPAEPSLLFPPAKKSNLLKGTSASPGFAVGPIFKIEKEVFEYDAKSTDIQADIKAFNTSLASSMDVLSNEVAKQKAADNTEKFEILAAHLELLDDPTLAQYTLEHINNNASAPAAWQATITAQVNILEALDNPLMQQRATDLRDVGSRVMRILLGKKDNALTNLPDNVILVAEEFTPTDISNIDPSKVSAVLSTGGSASSHASIIARSQGIPMVAAVNDVILEQANNTQVIVDANKGTVLLAPTETQLSDLETKRVAADLFAEKAQAKAHLPALTTDNVEIEVAANIGDVNDAKKAADNGADGIGLLRSEFLFLERLSAPTEEDQYQAYKTMFEGIGSDKPVIVRTLDVGGDKPLPYVPVGAEENPFLGERGIRITLDRPELLRVQFRALLRASVGNKLRIMLPMIASLNELRLARKVLNEESASLGITDVELGVMIEVPSAAIMADVLAQEADFFSIGTNDLVQYTVAIDRGNSRLASLADNLDPAVLRMIDLTVKGARKHNRWVGVCGGMAAQEIAQPILVGLGVNELSVNISSIAETKYRVRTFNLADCQTLAQAALACESTQAVKDLVNNSKMLDVK